MNKLKRNGIFSTVSSENFIGRKSELEALVRHAGKSAPAGGIVLSSAPALGASELLRQTFDHLFYGQQEVVPVYFSLNKSDKTVYHAALRFLQKFLQQTVAFRRRNEKLLFTAPDVCEISQLAMPSDGHWIDRLVETCQSESRLNDEFSFVRSCLSAPVRAAVHGTRSFVMIDNIHDAVHFSEEYDLIGELTEIYSRAGIPVVFSGRRRFTSGGVSGDFKNLQLKPLSFDDAGLLSQHLAKKYAVNINDQTRDLIAVQLGGRPAFIHALFQAAHEKNVDLDSFRQVENIYADEVFGGRIAGFYDRIFEEITPNAETQKNILGLLYDVLTVDKEKTPVESWQNRTNLPDKDFYRTFNLLNIHEVIRLSSKRVEPMDEQRVLNDYLTARYRLEIGTESRAKVVGEMLTEFIKRAPELMARHYRQGSSIGLRELLAIFDGQEVPPQLFDYAAFKSELKGATDEEIAERLEKEKEKERLPQIVYTAHTVAFYPPIEQFSERERSAVALGFAESTYTDEDEIVWIAAEIDSKLEAAKDLTEFWCDRLEAVALMCNFPKYRLWLVTPEGFSPEAVEILRQRNAYGSSRKQVDLLVKCLKAEHAVGQKPGPNEYEIVLPMGDDTELIAVQIVEEIARRHDFKPKAVNQIKTALVEACINATEHSLSPDRRIYQKFAVENGKIVITVANRGLRLTDRKAREIAPDSGRRGWGLKLIKSLMDEVKFEQTDDGTRISMTKYLDK